HTDHVFTTLLPFSSQGHPDPRALHSFPTRRSSDLTLGAIVHGTGENLIHRAASVHLKERRRLIVVPRETPLSMIQLENMRRAARSEEHTSELQSRENLVCRLLLEKKKKNKSTQ